MALGDFAMMEGKWWCVRHLALISLSSVAVVAQRSCPAGEKTLTIRMTAAGTTADGSEFFILSIVKVHTPSTASCIRDPCLLTNVAYTVTSAPS